VTHDEILEQAVNLGMACEISEWMDLKKILLVSIPSPARKNFSIRDSKTKRQHLNDFEHWLIDNYYQQVGTKLRFKEQ
jgi:hypothetical protein